jgi:Uma2 family endonuclease
MGMPQTAHSWTADEVRALPDDGRRYEVVAGELFVTPAPSWPHQWVVGGLFWRLTNYLRGQSWGEVVMSPADISFHEDMLVQPDLFVVPIGPDKRRPRQWADVHALLLAVEVLSPSTARADRQAKRGLYQREGVGEYWVVDSDARVVERWRPEDDRPEIVTSTLTWQPEPSAPAFELPLAEFFEDVLRESVG